MGPIVSIDPGIHGCGLAVFAQSTLLGAEYVSGIGCQMHPLLEIVDGIERSLNSIMNQIGTIDTIVIETPQVYQTAHQKGDQRDLVDLAIVVGGILAVSRSTANAALLVRPAEWKGQLPKDVSAKRVISILGEDERSAIELPTASRLYHNVLDAIGIGLWRLGRSK